jgi:hypothetical protein
MPSASGCQYPLSYHCHMLPPINVSHWCCRKGFGGRLDRIGGRRVEVGVTDHGKETPYTLRLGGPASKFWSRCSLAK